MTLTPELARLQNTHRFEIHGLPQHPIHGSATPYVLLPFKGTNVAQENWDDVGLVVMDGLKHLYQQTFPTLKPSRNPTDYRWFFAGTKLKDGLDLPSYELHARSESWTWAPIQ